MATPININQKVKTTTAFIGCTNAIVESSGTTRNISGSTGERASELFAVSSENLQIRNDGGHNQVKGASDGTTSVMDLQNVKNAVIMQKDVSQSIEGGGDNSTTAGIHATDSQNVCIEIKGGTDTIKGNSGTGSSTASILSDGGSVVNVKASGKKTRITK